MLCSSSQVGNVGHGAVEAAMRACETDVSKLVCWPAGQPVPYTFLADTFEGIAETSKRLTITSMLVGCSCPTCAACRLQIINVVHMTSVFIYVFALIPC